jgi:hypothetical protein
VLMFRCDVDSVLLSNTRRFPIELNGICVRSLPGPMHLGPKTGPLCLVFCIKLEESCSFTKVPDDSYT